MNGLLAEFKEFSIEVVENVTRMQWVQLKHVESGQVQLLLTLKQSDIGARMISEAQ